MKKNAQLHLRLIQFVGLIVPRRLRADWRQEWEAELRHRETLLADWDKLNWQSKLDLWRRSIGACKDALLLQPQRWEDEMIQDLRFGVRLLRQQRGFALITILTLALGIGATTTLFSVVDAVLLRPLPFAAPERLVQIERADHLFRLLPDASAEFMTAKLPMDLFDDVAAYEVGSVNLTDERTPERVGAMRATGAFFSMLGVAPLMGRTFGQAEQSAATARVVVLSYRLWQNHFGGDAQVLNQTIKLNGNPYTIIGVMPRSFRFTQFLQSADLWIPLVPGENLFANEAIFFEVGARLRAGLTLAQAQAQTDAIFEQVWSVDPTNKPEEKHLNRIELKPFSEKFAGEFRQPLLILLGAVGCVLLLACVNAANLLLARASARQKEVAVRATLGATRFRLVRQWMTESTLLALLGGAVGVWLATFGIKVLMRFNPVETTSLHDIEINVRVLGFALLISLLTGWLYGLIPAWQASRPNLTVSLKESGQRSRVVSLRLRRWLTISEVALSLLLLVGAGLMLKSFRNLMQVPLGFDAHNVLTFELTPPRVKYPNRAARSQFYQQVLERVQTLPGVQVAGFGNHLPVVAGGFMIAPLQVVGRANTKDNFNSGAYRVVSADYFRALQIPLLAGRFFTTQDHAESVPVIIIDQRLARRIFGDANPLGQRVSIFNDAKTLYEIVGVVGNTKTRSLEFMQDHEFYLHSMQRAPSFGRVALRTQSDPTSLISAIRQAVWEVDREQPVHNLKTMEQHLSESFAQRRFSTSLLTGFAAIALVLALIGLYGVMSYTVAQRTHELGLRMALGASPGVVLRLVLRQGVLLIAGGLLLGGLAAWWLSRFLASLLFEVEPRDPVVMLIATFLLSTVALLACYLPARRASRVDPLVALRHE